MLLIFSENSSKHQGLFHKGVLEDSHGVNGKIIQ